MDKKDKEKINKIIMDRKKANGYLLKNSKVYNSFIDLEQKTFEDGNLTKKTKELIATGISIVINCESCMEWHIKEAIISGANEQEILEAIEVGIEMGGGPATVSSRFALKVLEYYLDFYKEKEAIREISNKNEIRESVEVIKKSFNTVAKEFKLTKENCPTHPSFITVEKIKEMQKKGIKLFGLFVLDKQIGFVAVEKSTDNIYYLEKLAVMPEFRHKDYGKKLLDFVYNYVKDNNGKKISIAIIDESKILKKWYIKYGFIEKSKKKFEHLPFTVCFLEKDIIPEK